MQWLPFQFHVTKENRIHFEGDIIQLSPEGEVNSGG